MDAYSIEWNDELSIGDAELDAEHRHLIQLIAQVPDMPAPGDAPLLAAALEFAKVHFEAEEAYMRLVGYPGLAAHASDHRILTRTLLVHMKRYDEGGTDPRSLKQFLFRWTRDHIMGEDRKFGLYMASQSEE